MTATMTPLSGTAATVGTHRSSGRYFLRRMVQYRPGFISFLVIILLYLAAFVGPLLYRRSPNEIDLLNLLGHPSAQHLLGTDDNGRDILARLLDGGHVSLIVGLIAVVIADTVGVLFGAFAGYFGKFTDAILMRITDALLAIPSFFLLLVVLSLFGPFWSPRSATSVSACNRPRRVGGIC
ncbi:MAG: ABC transporter permease subunit [Thermomicrobia bacterium]|nr:ABC transporter permease subunit [Thermomicrobia bacterium]